MTGCRQLLRFGLSTVLALPCFPLHAHPLSFNSTVTYSSSQPSSGSSDIANWTGAAFDAANIGGSGVNADGGANNGLANDSSTYVAGNQPRQGQSFTTGSNPNGYNLTAVTARMAGYTNNTATGTNRVSWNLDAHSGPVIVEIGKVSGTTFTTTAKHFFIMGGEGTPGASTSTNGAGTYITFHLPFTTHLEPNTAYAFDFTIGNGSANFFEWLGTSTDPYASGSAYNRSGGILTPLSGDRVFQLELTAPASPVPAFAHPGTLHTEADLQRMREKIAANAQPWKADYDVLVNSPWAQTWWPAYNVDYIVRGDSGNNYTRSQQDAQALYELALRWHLTGDAAYADKAVQIANVWSDLLGVTGNTNKSLAAGICGYLFASGGELLSTYSGWPEAEKQAYKDMMMRVFYQSNLDFLWRHHDTPFTKGGNTHYRLNWDTANMASMAAIGILCDNRAVYEQALDFFKYGPGNSRIERAAWYIHPGGLAQTEESGRDQAHNLGGWHAMALLCQMAWNQGDDLFGYDNNRALRAFEYNAKYNLWNDVPWIFHRNTDLAYTEALSGGVRGIGQYFQYELVYNHYVNVKGLAAPWSKLAADATRPEPRPNPSIHTSQVDWFGLGSLTYTRDPIVAGAAPSGVVANWSKNKVGLTWWGSATATHYEVKRSMAPAGPYTTVGQVAGPDLVFSDTTVENGAVYYYVVTAITPGGSLDSTPLRVAQQLVTHYTFEGNANDVVGTRHGQPKGGATAAGFITGFGGGQALSMNGATQYVQLPPGTGNYQDITLAAWVYWNGGASWQRIFDFGTEIEKNMFLTPSDGGSMRFAMTTSRNADSAALVGPTLATGQWVHVAVSLNGDVGTLYINGIPADTKVIDWIDPLFGQPFCYLGRSMWNGDAYFNGRIDDFRIYNYGLTGNEVYSLWGQSTNHAPVFANDPLSRAEAVQGTAYTTQSIYSAAGDVDGGTLTFSKIGGPSWLSVAPNGALSGTPANSDNGVNRFVVRVTDSSGASDDAALYITVNNTNEAPSWSSATITKPVVTRDQAYAGSTLAENAQDPDSPYGDSLVFSKVSGPSWLIVADSGTLSGTPSAADVGENTFTVRVTDEGGLSVDATLNITVLPFTLRSLYSFEGNVVDSAGGFTGATTGSPVYASGRTGQGITLDGSDDYVTLPAGVASYRDITVAAWVWWNGGNNWQRIFDFGNNTSQYMQLTPNSGGGMRFAINNGGGEQQLNTTALPTGRWVHVAVTLSGGTGTLYVNGAIAATNTGMTLNPDDFKPAVNYLGKSQFADPLFNGLIDDFRVYNYALSSTNVSDLVGSLIPPVPTDLVATGGNGSSQVALSWTAAGGATSYAVKRATVSGGPYTTVYSGATASFADATVSAGVTYYYVVTAINAAGESAGTVELARSANINQPRVLLRMDELSGSTASDSSGNGWNGTLSGGSTWVAGKINNAVSLSGSTNYASLPSGVLTGVTDCTFSTWVKVNSLSSWARIFDFGTGTTNYLFLAPQTSGGSRLRFAIRTPSIGEQQIESSVTTPVGSWFHVAVTFSGSTGRLYLNGTEVGSNTGMTLTPSSLGTATQNYLGKSQFAADPYLNGALDEFQIYGRALNAAEISTLAVPPIAPTGVTATAGNAQVVLNWSAVSGATGYDVKRAEVSGGPYAVVASNVSGTTWTNSGLVNSTAYYYVVTARKGVTESPNSTQVTATPTGAPPVPADLATAGGDGAVALTWTASFGATSYNVQRSISAGGTYATIGTSSGAAYSDAAVANGTTYYYKVTAIGPNGESAASSVANATPMASPVAPSGLAAVAGNATVTLSWNASSGATSYNLKRSTTTGSDYEIVATLTSPGYVDTSVENGTPYYYVVSALNSAGEGLDSAEATATPVAAPAAPTGTLVSSGNAQAALLWQAVSGATSYTVKRSTVSGGPYTVIASGLTATNYYDTSVVNGTTYYYVISALNAGGESVASTQLVVTPNNNPLRAHLRMDELSGSNLKDSSGNGWDGSLSGGSTWVAGKINNAVSLSGTTNYASLPTGVVAGMNDFTISTWVKINSLSTWARIFDFGTGTTNYLFLAPQSSAGSRLRFAIRTPSTGEQLIDSSVTTPVGSWFHVAVTLSGGTGRLYLNGVQVGSNATMTLTPASLGATNLNYLGRSQFADPYLNGQLDEFQIYGRTLSATEVSSLVSTFSAPTGLAAVASDASVSLSWNAVAGATGYRVKRSYSPGGPYATEFATVTDTTFTDTNLAMGSPYYYVVTAVKNLVESVNSAEATATPGVIPGAPTDVAATSVSSTRIGLSWSPTAHAASYQVKRATVSGGPYTTVSSTVSGTSFTDTGLSANTTYYYVVSAVGSGEGANSGQASATTSDLRARYAFDEASGTGATDLGGDAYHGSLTNGALWATGHQGNAVDLDGTDDYLSVPSGVVSGLTDFSVSAWVYLNAVSNWSRLFDFGTGTTAYMCLMPMNGTNGKVRFSITTSGGSGEQQIDGASALPAGAWTHVAITHSGNLGILYVNGVEAGRNSSMTLNPSFLGITTLNFIGKSQYTDPCLNGRVDDFRIYPRALSASEIGASALPASALTTYQAWKVSSGLAANASDTAAPDADGIPLLLKYATGRSVGVLSASAPVLPQRTNGQMTLNFVRLAPAAVTYAIETSENLTTWTTVSVMAAGEEVWTGSAAVQETGSGGTRSVIVTPPVPLSAHQFGRLRAIVP